MAVLKGGDGLTLDSKKRMLAFIKDKYEYKKSAQERGEGERFGWS